MSAAALIRAFERSFTTTDLVLYAGTNLHGLPQSNGAFAQAGMMPVIGPGTHKQQWNVQPLVQLEQLASRQLCEIFRGSFAEARFHSCTQANLAVFLALLKPGDTVLCLASSDGGHASQNHDGVLSHLAVQIETIPFDADHQCVDDIATAALVRSRRPRLVVYGPSVIVRPSGLTRTAAACADVDATLMVDVSHVAGLIAGGAFPNPLEHGADLLTASSYKTLGCPPAGFIVARDQKLRENIEQATSPKLLSNYDASRLQHFASALENSREYFQAYARAMVANADALRAALLERNIPVLTPADGVFGTHQVVVLTNDKEHAARTMDRLQSAGVSASLCGIPGRQGSSGVRLGTQLVTRRGMGSEQMPRIASIIADAVGAEADTNLRLQVQRLAADFPNLAFCKLSTPHGQ